MAGTPLWVKLFGLVIVGLLLVVVVVLLTGSSGGGHGPQQHSALALIVAGESFQAA